MADPDIPIEGLDEEGTTPPTGPPASGPTGPTDYSQFHKKLVDAPQTYDYNSLAGSFLDIYLRHTKYTDKDGVERYRTDFTASSGDAESLDLAIIAEDMVNSALYHLLKRQFRMDDQQANIIMQAKDPYNISLPQALLDYFLPGTTAKELETTLGEDPSKVTLQSTMAIANDAMQKYDRVLLDRLLRDQFGDNSEKLKEGLWALERQYRIMGEGRLRTVLEDKNSQQLMGLYVQMLQGARKKE